MARDTSKLTAKEELFVEAYLAHGNATQAAKDAGFSERTAYAKGAELTKRPRVAKAIQAKRQRITKKFRVTAERVVEEMALIGFSDVRHYCFTGDGYVALAPDAPDAAMRAVKRIKRKMRTIPRKDDEPIVEVDTEIELWSKDTELRHLGDYLKLFKENRADDDDGDELTAEQRKERIIALLKIAAKRKAAATGVRKKAG